MGRLIMETKKQKGRKGDVYLAHLTPGEIIIPRQLAEDDSLRIALTRYYDQNKIDIRQFIVGDKSNKTNPETGYLEFSWLSKAWKSVTSFVGGLFGGGESVKPPPLPPPIAIPEVSKKAPEYAMRAARRRWGFEKTLMMGELTPRSTGKKTVLG